MTTLITIKRCHFVYRITNISTTPFIYYYGTRTTSKYKEKSPTEELGISYFSTSKDKEFIKDQKDNPQNYKYKVIKIFNTRKEALELEIYLHKKFDVKLHEQFYNRSNQTSTGFDTTNISFNVGRKASKNTILKAVSTRYVNDSYKSGGVKTSKFLKSKEWKESDRYKEILEGYNTPEHKLIMSNARKKCNDKITHTKSLIGEDGLFISRRCQLKNAKKYNLYNHLNVCINKEMYNTDVRKLNQALLKTNKQNKLGKTRRSKLNLNSNFKLHMIGWYIKEVK